MEWWDKMVFPMRRAWIGISARFGFRKHGLLKLKRDVRSCEYEDVHVMWGLLNRTTETDLLPQTTATRRNRSRSSSSSSSSSSSRRRPFWKVFGVWSSRCREF